MTDPIKLFVIGDSFSVMPGKDDPALTWIRKCAADLAELTGQQVNVINASIMGASQDYMWVAIHGWIESGQLGPNDYLMIALTHPGRYWYLDRIPELSNSNIIDLDKWCSAEESRAIELFIKHIQRPMLDTVSLINRLTYLSYHVLKKGLRKPLIVKCFQQELHQAGDIEELNITEGSLYEDIQYWEFDQPDFQLNNNYFSGVDCRYNHMCLTNHEILGARAAVSLVDGSALDLREGYHQSLFKTDTLSDKEFCDRELDGNMLARRAEKANVPRLPWLKRMNLDKAASTCVQKR